MKKLTEKNIQFVDEYLKRNGVKYWDVRLELMDHIICETERLMNSGHSFQEAMEIIHKSFGNKVFLYAWEKGENTSGKSICSDSKGYHRIIEEKRLLLNKEVRKKQKEVFLGYLNKGSFTATTFLVLIFLFFNITPEYFKVTYLTLIFVNLGLCLFIWIRHLRIINKKTLILKVSVGFVGLSISLMNVGLLMKNFFEGELARFVHHYTTLALGLISVFISFIAVKAYLEIEKKYVLKNKDLLYG